MWQDKAKKYAGDAGHFLYEHKGKIAFAVVVAASVYWFGIRPINAYNQKSYNYDNNKLYNNTNSNSTK
ncbi:hypothetical protein AGMMS49953_03680 [Endomicrobiia bacterium]|nr:hypothetical protein AGMMS49953_03680 [Endomicrobiia bacterium]